MIKYVADSGADAVKFQTFIPGDAERLMSKKDITIDFTTKSGKKKESVLEALKRRELSKKDALNYYTVNKNEYKSELIENLEGKITFCDHSNFTDLCKGGHLPNTGFIKSVKLLNVAGAYWRGDENNKQLTRIYGVSFLKNKELTEYLTLLEEAKKRDAIENPFNDPEDFD